MRSLRRVEAGPGSAATDGFTIAVEVVQRAQRFYRHVFGLRRICDLAREPAARRRCGGAGEEPAAARLIVVPDLDACLDRVDAFGGRVIFAKMRIGTVGWVAYCEDSEGNVVCLRQHATAPRAGQLPRARS